MPLWNPWRGCHRYSDGCRYCYTHKGDAKRGLDTNCVVKCETTFHAPIMKYKRGARAGEYKLPSGSLVNVCFSSDFLIEEADPWRQECFDIIKERQDCTFLFLTKRIDRFESCMPEDWSEGYDNLIIGCTVENQKTADYRLDIFRRLPIKHKNIICQPLLEDVDIEQYLQNVELVVVGGESDRNARPLNYDWVLHIRDQCLRQNVAFNFRQCGSHFIKDGVMYNLSPFQLMSQARKAGIDT